MVHCQGLRREEILKLTVSVHLVDTFFVPQKDIRQGLQIPPDATNSNDPNAFAFGSADLCVGRDLNLRRPKPTDLQSVAIDRSATDAFVLSLCFSFLILVGYEDYKLSYQEEIGKPSILVC